MVNPRGTNIGDAVIRAALTAAVERTLVPAMSQPAYPGHFTVTADGRHYGAETTWPGLDSWQMAGAYLLLGHRQLVRDYFAFVRASQRGDGNVPFAIFPAESRPEPYDTYLRGLRFPADVYEYGGRKWIGLFHHWQTRVNPLSVLGPICHVLTAGEMAGEAPSGWLADNIGSIEAAGRYVLSRQSGNGLIAGAGCYVESPPRDQWDGVTQCYSVYALRELARMREMLGDASAAARWRSEADVLSATFCGTFWRGDHFAEYVHPQRGVVDLRGLSDVDFAAIALGVATDEQAHTLWPLLARERGFWHGGMPTQLIAPSGAYETWEHPEPLPFEHVNGPVYDAAAMGRVWFLDALASMRMGDVERLRESVRLVCRMGERHGWQWHERYHAQPDGTVKPAGPAGYCEYAAVLLRVILGDREVFAA